MAEQLLSRTGFTKEALKWGATVAVEPYPPAQAEEPAPAVRTLRGGVVVIDLVALGRNNGATKPVTRGRAA